MYDNTLQKVDFLPFGNVDLLAFLEYSAKSYFFTPE